MHCTNLLFYLVAPSAHGQLAS